MAKQSETVVSELLSEHGELGVFSSEGDLLSAGHYSLESTMAALAEYAEDDPFADGICEHDNPAGHCADCWSEGWPEHA